MSVFDYKNPDYLPIFKDRIKRVDVLRDDQEIVQAAKLHYKHNPVDLINDWGMTYDPRKSPSHIPFLLWPKQVEYILWLKDRFDNKEDGLVEKSRDAGATYLNCIFATWLWLFHDGSKSAFGSRKESLVDKIGDPDTIFEKIRMIIRAYPKELLPIGYEERRNATFMKIINPENGSTITGESGDNIGRGGRNSIYFKDEAAFYERPEKIDAALSENSDVKIDVSTPNGTGNPFWKKRHSGKFPVFVFDWKDDPRKDQAWYNKKKEETEPWILAQEVDRDYSAAVEGVCIPAIFVRAAVGLHLKNTGMPVAGLDVADEAGNNVLSILEGSTIKKLYRWSGINTTQTSRKAISICNEEHVILLNYDSIGVGAGVTGEASELKELHTGDGSFMPMVMPVNTGSDKLTGMYNDTIPDSIMFVNMRACLWWKARRRFEKTYETVEGIKAWPDEDLISIPNDPELISQLSQPLVKHGNGGKIQIESKKDMRTRGIASPDDADSVILALANPELIPQAISKYAGFNVIHRTVDYITGKTTVKPWIEKNQNTNRYIQFEE